MLQNILSFLVVALLQVAGVFLLCGLVFGIYLGPSAPNLLAVMAVYALLCVSFAVCLAVVQGTPASRHHRFPADHADEHAGRPVGPGE